MSKMKKYIASILCLFLLSVSASINYVLADIIDVEDFTIEVNGVITTTLRDEDSFYIGGSFEEIEVEENQPVERINLAEIDLESGNIAAWNPRPDGPVQDMVLYDDTLFIGGQFTTFNGVEHPYLVQVHTDTKDVETGLITSDDPIYGLFIDEDILYVSGSFTTLNEQNRSYIASYNLVDDKLTSWSPEVNDTVYDVVADDERIYIAGAFTEVNGEVRNQIAAFDKDTEELIDWNPSSDLIITNISVLETGVEVTGFIRTDDEIEARRVLYDTDSVEEIRVEKIPISSATSYSAIWKQEDRESTEEALMIDQEKLGFQIPTLSDILTFAIRAFFVIAGLAALFFLLLGAFAWVTSGGDQDSITAAREKIQAAVVGLLMMVAVLAVVWTLEQVIFNRRICLGLSCPVTIPALLEPVE